MRRAERPACTAPLRQVFGRARIAGGSHGTFSVECALRRGLTARFPSSATKRVGLRRIFRRMRQLSFDLADFPSNVQRDQHIGRIFCQKPEFGDALDGKPANLQGGALVGRWRDRRRSRYRACRRVHRRIACAQAPLAPVDAVLPIWVHAGLCGSMQVHASYAGPRSRVMSQKSPGVRPHTLATVGKGHLCALAMHKI